MEVEGLFREGPWSLKNLGKFWNMLSTVELHENLLKGNYVFGKCLDAYILLLYARINAIIFALHVVLGTKILDGMKDRYVYGEQPHLNLRT